MMLWVLNMGEEFWELGHADDLLGRGRETVCYSRAFRKEERVEQMKLSPSRGPDPEDTVARASSTVHATLPALKSIQHDY